MFLRSGQREGGRFVPTDIGSVPAHACEKCGCCPVDQAPVVLVEFELCSATPRGIQEAGWEVGNPHAVEQPGTDCWDS